MPPVCNDSTGAFTILLIPRKYDKKIGIWAIGTSIFFNGLIPFSLIIMINCWLCCAYWIALPIWRASVTLAWSSCISGMTLRITAAFRCVITTNGVKRIRITTVLSIIVANHGTSMETWIHSRAFCKSPIGEFPPRPSEANVGSPLAASDCTNSPTGCAGRSGISSVAWLPEAATALAAILGVKLKLRCDPNPGAVLQYKMKSFRFYLRSNQLYQSYILCKIILFIEALCGLFCAVSDCVNHAGALAITWWFLELKLFNFINERRKKDFVIFFFFRLGTG